MSILKNMVLVLLSISIIISNTSIYASNTESDDIEIQYIRNVT